MKTEKVSVNLNHAELGQIDLLVARGVFDNRSDFMRAAARKSLEGYEETFRQFLQPERFIESSNNTLVRTIGIMTLSRRYIEQLIRQNIMLDIRIIGLLKIDADIPEDALRQVVKSCKIHGKIMASEGHKAILLDAE